jgi:hypothetical protein
MRVPAGSLKTPNLHLATSPSGGFFSAGTADRLLKKTLPQNRGLNMDAIKVFQAIYYFVMFAYMVHQLSA